MALVDPVPGLGNVELVVEGVLEGEILDAMRDAGVQRIVFSSTTAT